MKKLATVNTINRETLLSALNKLTAFPSLKVNGLYASELTELQNSEAELFNEISEMIKADRWCPFAGAFFRDADLNSTTLIKSCLYSAQYYKKTFGKDYRVFHGKRIYCNSFPQTVYSSLFDACVLDEEDRCFWLHSADEYYTLVFSAETTDISDIDEKAVSENEFLTYEELAQEMFNSELSLETVHIPASFDEMTDEEKLLTDIEHNSVIKGKSITAEICSAWLSYIKNGKINDIGHFDGKTAERDIIKAVGDGVVVSEVKFAEDNSGDVILRVRETAGKEQGAYIMADSLNAGFRFEIMPYEIQTFKIPSDGSGTVTEIYICE